MSRKALNWKNSQKSDEIHGFCDVRATNKQRLCIVYATAVNSAFSRAGARDGESADAGPCRSFVHGETSEAILIANFHLLPHTRSKSAITNPRKYICLFSYQPFSFKRLRFLVVFYPRTQFFDTNKQTHIHPYLNPIAKKHHCNNKL